MHGFVLKQYRLLTFVAEEIQVPKVEECSMLFDCCHDLSPTDFLQLIRVNHLYHNA